MKERFVYQVITEPKSAPAGIDWLMIGAARGVVPPENDPQEQIPADLRMERSERQPLVNKHRSTATVS